MENGQSYNGLYIDAHSYEVRGGKGWTSQSHIKDSSIVTPFFLNNIFPTKESALKAGIEFGKHKIDSGFRGDINAVRGWSLHSSLSL
jgi:hypothetical protein